MKVHTVERPEYTEYFLTLGGEGGQPLKKPPRSALAEVGAFLAEKGIQPIQEKLYGKLSAKREILETRKAVFQEHGLNPSLPLTFIEGCPFSTEDFCGVQLWGISPRNRDEAAVSTIECPGNIQGRSWSAAGGRFVYLPSVRGKNGNGALPPDAPKQAEQMFQNAARSLDAHGLSLLHVVRTWIYISQFGDWYGKFNAARTTQFKKHGLIRENGDSYLPASTGIQGRSGDEECIMDVLALSPGESSKARVRLLGNKRQNEAFAYGSAFSRGAVVDMEGKKTVFVSGTASINEEGETVYLNDPEGQAMETLLNIASILEAEGGSLEDICMATVFCKNEESLEAYQRISRLLCLPAFPAVTLITDICRPELLIEIEATAVC
jgi:enamine deaminase RidA (YjgF/YER057c/UK114 family)